MRSGTNCIINSGQVHSWSLGLLLDAKLVKDHGWKCTAAIVLGVTLRAAARCISISAACRDLAKAPSDQAVMTALEEGLPKTLACLGTAVERRLDRPAAETHASSGVECRHRLALAALLRTAVAKPQRTLLRPAQAGNHEVSRLRLGLHRGIRTALHAWS